MRLADARVYELGKHLRIEVDFLNQQLVRPLADLDLHSRRTSISHSLRS